MSQRRQPSASAEGKRNPPMPKLLDMQGNPIDPGTRLEVATNPDGQTGTDSIFHVSSAPDARRQLVGIEGIMESLRAAGFEGDTVHFNIIPRDEEEEQRIDEARFRRASPARLYPTACSICSAVLADAEKFRGFRLNELRESARAGCDPCSILYRSVIYFADMLLQDYDREDTRVMQRDNEDLRLLSQTKEVSVHFEDYSSFSLTFSVSDSHDSPGLRGSKYDRIMDTSSYETINCIKSWLNTCAEEHKDCAIPPLSKLPKRVLDVANGHVRLYETQGEIAPYLTLSHCWGSATVTKVTTTTLDAMKEEIPWKMLSKTFQDALMLTWRLGYRYLWIDGLCILQDSKEDWEVQASKMAQIFSNSQLTIAASRGADGTVGLFSCRANEPINLGQYGQVQSAEFWQSYNIQGHDRDGVWKDFTVRVKTPHGLFDGSKPKVPLLKRAWVFQEQILSPRIIHFADGELYFECKSHVACECMGWSERAESTQWETRWRKAHAVLQKRRSLTRSDQEPLPKLATDQYNPERSRLFEAYRSLIETYTTLDITYGLDRLPALSGITSGRKDDYLAGMWRGILLECLHWQPRESRKGDKFMANRPVEYRGPSWSWVSIVHPIDHVEDDFYRFDSSARHVAKIIASSCKSEGSDPHGRVVNGCLRIQGPVLTARVTGIRLDNRADVDWRTYAMLRKGRMQGECKLDVPLALCRAEPTEVAVGQLVTCLLISTYTAMVLKPVDATPGAYQRVGLFKISSRDVDAWFEDGAEDSVFVL